jgi:hypothetical protein
MPSGDSWLRLRSGQPRRLLGPEPLWRPWLRWPKRGAGVLLRGGDPSARVAVRGRAKFHRRWKQRQGCCRSLCRCLNLQEQFVCSMRMFVAAAEAQTSYCRVMSEVSVSQRRRSPSARSALPLTCTLTRPQDSVIDIVEKARKSFWQKSFRALGLVRLAESLIRA